MLQLLLAATLSVQSDAPEISFDGLHLEESKKVAVLYAKPDADFSVYFENETVIHSVITHRPNSAADLEQP